MGLKDMISHLRPRDSPTGIAPERFGKWLRAIRRGERVSDIGVAVVRMRLCGVVAEILHKDGIVPDMCYFVHPGHFVFGYCGSDWKVPVSEGNCWFGDDLIDLGVFGRVCKDN